MRHYLLIIITNSVTKLFYYDVSSEPAEKREVLYFATTSVKQRLETLRFTEIHFQNSGTLTSIPRSHLTTKYTISKVINLSTKFKEPSSYMAERDMHIKRPMNCFMLWSREKRCEILKKNPGINNAVISKMLGEAWRKLSDKEKKPYVKEAKRLTAKLLEDHPDYKYRPRRRKTKTPESRKPTIKTDLDTTGNIPYSPAAFHPAPYSQPAQLIHPQGFWPKYASNYQKISSENDPPTPTFCLSPTEVCNPVRTAFPFRALPSYGYCVYDQDMLSSPYYVNWCNPRSAWLQNQM